MQNGIKKRIEKRKKKEYLIQEIKFTLGLMAVVGGSITSAIYYWIQYGYGV